MNFCKCGSIIVNGKCTNEHCPEKDQKLKDWVIEGRNMDFKKPVTYEEAANLARRLKAKKKKV